MLSFCTQVIELSEYRGQLFDYLKSRMAAVAPNLTVLVGELVGARLIAHAGSLINLAKQPASTVQILGAEKALFRCAALALPCRTGRLIAKPACSGSLPQPGV
jgi:nucleolar protein 58